MPQAPQRDAQLPSAAASVDPTPHANLKRRRFLLALGAGSAAGAAAATQALATPVAPTAAADAAATAKQGYRETQHVRDYYASTRL
jgi:hypothetical protein